VTIKATDGTDAAAIARGERDHDLKLHLEKWGPDLRKPLWEGITKPDLHYVRKLVIREELLEESQDPVEAPEESWLEEKIIRIPSAPIYGINRKVDYSITFKERPNMHTLRVLGRADDPRPVGRLFLFHSGLNETDNLRFYYRLADWLLEAGEKEDKVRSACLVSPFPGHLMHAPFPGPFAQTPLSRYLSDSGELFRQFLRYMVEMRWLLSIVNSQRPEPWMVGGKLLPRDELSKDLIDEWDDLRKASREAFEDQGDGRPLSKAKESEKLGLEIDETEVQSMIDVLGTVLDLQHPDSPASIPVHVVGYSLGGFVAQSVFFAWPNIVSSCSTICSGGAIRALSPTAFAHPEEWQAVLHTLRPELEESMLRGRIARRDDRIVGLTEDQFAYYQRIFDQVFLQEDKASYEARLSEYGTRMLFISGGDDPIVRAEEVMDASPDEGITMLSIASLTHFLDKEPRTEREIEQREFWLPEAGRLIGRAAARAELLHEYERQDVEEEHAKIEQTLEGNAKTRSPKEPKKPDLSSPDFEDALDWVIDGVKTTRNSESEGWLFVCRSELPAAFLNPDMHRVWGTNLHHHDVSVQRYAMGLARRAAELDSLDPRVTLLLPSSIADKEKFAEMNSEFVDPHSDAPGYLTTKEEWLNALNYFSETWGQRTRLLDAGPVDESLLGSELDEVHARFARAVASKTEVPSDYLKIAHLPNVWICVNNFVPPLEPVDARTAIERFVISVAEMLEAEVRREGPKSARAGRPPKPATPENSKLAAELEEGKVRIVRVSGGELNPRYRGKFEQSPSQALQLLAHCAGALVRSRPATVGEEGEVPLGLS
jgi:hypothetical protein